MPVSARWTLTAIACVLGTLLIATLVPYRGNVTSLFHMDDVLRAPEMPAGFVILDQPAYDGAQYYRIARRVPDFFRPAEWDSIAADLPRAYGYQRMLLPVIAFMLSMGNVAALPFAFLAINSASLLLAAWLFLRRWPHHPLAAAALALGPAATVSMHFMLAEPLTILLVTAFLVRFTARASLGWTEALLLSLLVLSREVNVVFVAVLGAYLIGTRQWKNIPWLVPSATAFLAWHLWIYAVFGDIPFLESGGKSALPFTAMFALIAGAEGFNRFTLTSIPLALLVVLPGLAWTARLAWTGRDRSFQAIGALALLLVMASMPDHIWGSITSIGRVITPTYPLLLATCVGNASRMGRFLPAAIITIGLGAGIALALSIHPFHLA